MLRREQLRKAFLTGGAVAALSMGATGCVRDAPKPRNDAPPPDVAIWDFPAEPGESTTLFPPDIGVPQRMKLHLGTSVEKGRFNTVVEGRDPQLEWQFDAPFRAFSVHMEFEAAEPGSIQVFWSTPRCPVFSEACSATAMFGAGRQVLDWFLDATDPLRVLRIDPPEHLGAKITFDRIVVGRSAALASVFRPNGGARDLAVTSAGLDVDAIAPDPWLVVPTPGLETKAVTAVELVLRGPSGEVPQLYWEPAASSGFSEACSLRLAAADAGELTHRGVLKRHPCWNGRIGMLRLDPGQNAGHYVIERLALVRSAAD